MRSFLIAAFAVAFASFVVANPNPEPEPNKIIHSPVCGGWTFGSCSPGLTCQKGPDNKYCCKTPPPPVCGGKISGTCPAGKTCKKIGHDYSCVPNGPVPSGKLKPKRSAFCAEGSVACPVVGLLHGFECIDVTSNIEQCGDCAVLGGVDCSALPGVDKVACVNGACRVESCTSGFVYDFRKRTCVSNSMWKIQPDQ